MIKLATVFSGIGAIEHALDRMMLEHEIVFACDNGDVDILTKKVESSYSAIVEALNTQKKLLNTEALKDKNDKKEYAAIKADLKANTALFEIAKKSFFYTDELFDNTTVSVLNTILKTSKGKKSCMKQYRGLLSEIELASVLEEKNIAVAQSSAKLIADFCKDNTIQSLTNGDVLSSRDDIEWNIVRKKLSIIHGKMEEYDCKKSLKIVRDVAERFAMTYEKIEELLISKKLGEMKSFEERKKYIDSLYKEKENSNRVKKSYMANYDITEENFHWNVSFLEGKRYKEKVDLFVGGSPCQSFSLVGKQRGLEDTRGTLFYEYARLVKEIQPSIFIYENVKAVLNNDNGKTWETMQHIFEELNYVWKAKVLNAKNYGIPQNRERLFVVGFRKDLELEKEFEFPDPIDLGDLTMKDLLVDNASGKYYLPAKGVRFVTDKKNLEKRYTQIDGEIQLCQKKNQQFNWHGDFVFEDENKEQVIKELEKYFLSEKVVKYVMSTGTKGFYAKPETDLDIARPLLTTMHKMHRAGVDNYVTTEGRLRKLTPRECLRLMGFCDSFKIAVSDTSMYQQAGNSIVVDVLINIVNSILESYPKLTEV